MLIYYIYEQHVVIIVFDINEMHFSKLCGWLKQLERQNSCCLGISRITWSSKCNQIVENCQWKWLRQVLVSCRVVCYGLFRCKIIQSNNIDMKFSVDGKWCDAFKFSENLIIWLFKFSENLIIWLFTICCARVQC